jgi:hypothetical protein
MAASPIVEMPDVASLPVQMSPALSQSAWPVAVSFLMLLALMVFGLIMAFFSGRKLEGHFNTAPKAVRKKVRGPQ